MMRTCIPEALTERQQLKKYSLVFAKSGLLKTALQNAEEYLLKADRCHVSCHASNAEIT